MLRFLAFRNISRVSQSFPSNSSSLASEGSNNGPLFRGFCSPQRFYSKYLCTSRPRAWNAVRELGRSGYIRSFSANSDSNTIAHRAQVGWKMLAQSVIHNGGSRFPMNKISQAVSLGLAIPARNILTRRIVRNGRSCFPMNKIAQAVSLGLNRSYLVVPGIFGLMCGTKLSQAHATQDMDMFQPRNNLYMRAQDSHLFLTRLVLSAFEGVYLLLRAFYLAILFTPSVVMAPFADTFGPRFRKIWLQVIHQTLERAGPAFIKWGQWAATRPDLFPRDLCAELSKLHTQAPEHSFAYTKKMIEKSFGRRISEIFDDFEEEPVASGSIAQVHRATLRSRYPGKQIKPMLVAVKVRHPGVGESIKRDFEIINIVAKVSNLIPALKWLRLDESVQQFAVFMMSQVDLAREAAHLSRFIYNFRSWRDVSFPKPVYPLVHPAVLVETFEHGECVSHYVDELEGNERVKSALAHIGTHALLKMLLVDNFVHADMHPGNILVRVAPRTKASRKKLFKTKPHVIFLDVGMTAELSKNDRVNLLEFFKAVARRDGKTAAESALKLSKKQKCPNPEGFIKEVTESFDFWGTPEGDLVHPADAMHQLLEKVRHHKVNVDGNVCTVMVTVLVLEGWQRKLDPDYDVMHTLQTLLLKADWAKSLSYTIEGLMAP